MRSHHRRHRLVRARQGPHQRGPGEARRHERSVDRRADRHPGAPHRRRPDEATCDLAFAPRSSARSRTAKLDPKDVEMIVVGTVTARLPVPLRLARSSRGSSGTRRPSPSTSRRPAPARSTRSRSADRFVASGAVKNALVIGADALTRISDWNDRNTCILFGDGAGAMVLKPTDDPQPRHPVRSHLHADGSLRGRSCTSPGGGSKDPISREGRRRSATHFIKMKGGEVFKVAVRALEETCREVARRREAHARRRHLRHRAPGEQADPRRDARAARDPGLRSAG